MSNNKITFDEMYESGLILPDEKKADQPIFKDKPKAYDFTILVLSIIAILSISGCFYYFSNVLTPIKDNVKVSGTLVKNEVSSDSTQYTNSKVNINTAGPSALVTLSGIGDVRALAIIAYREANGPFKNISEIKNVSGIGDITFEKIKNDICV